MEQEELKKFLEEVIDKLDLNFYIQRYGKELEYRDIFLRPKLQQTGTRLLPGYGGIATIPERTN